MKTRARRGRADRAQDDADAVVVEVDVDVRRARLLRSGGADDALPPTLKIDGDEESGEGRLLEAPVVVVVRHGDAAFSSSVITRSSGLRRVQLRCAFKSPAGAPVYRDRGPRRARRGPDARTIVGRRELSLFELAERMPRMSCGASGRACARPGGSAPEDEASSSSDSRTTRLSTGASTVVRGPLLDHHTRTALARPSSQARSPRLMMTKHGLTGSRREMLMTRPVSSAARPARSH